MVPWQHCQDTAKHDPLVLLCRCGPEAVPKRVQDAAKNQSAEKIECVVPTDPINTIIINCRLKVN